MAVARVVRAFTWIIHFLTSQKTTDALQEACTLDFHRIQNPFGEHPPMTDCIEPQLHFSFYPKQKLLLCFDGGQITSDAGLLLLRQFDQRHGLTAALAEGLADERRAASVDHRLPALLRQRIDQIVAGYEDGNDANRLRHDATFQLLAERSPGELLASQPTLSRWENRFTMRDWVAMNGCLCRGFAQLCRAAWPPPARSCWISTPPPIPPMASRSSASITALMIVASIIPCWSSNGTPDTCWRRICGAARWAARGAACRCCAAWCAGCSGSFPACLSAWWAMPALPFPRCMIFANAGECSTASASAPILSFNDAARRWAFSASAAACATASGKYSTVASGIAASAGDSARAASAAKPNTAPAAAACVMSSPTVRAPPRKSSTSISTGESVKTALPN